MNAPKSNDTPVRKIFLIFSIAVCATTLLAWFFAAIKVTASFRSPLLPKSWGFEISQEKGGMVFEFIRFQKGSPGADAWERYSGFDVDAPLLPAEFSYDTPGKTFDRPRIIHDENLSSFTGVYRSSRFLAPYWLIILVFALSPAFWFRRRYIEREKLARVGVPADHSAPENKKDAVDGVPPK
jgi:hypothetical protein